MLVSKCELCAKEIKDKESIVHAGAGGHLFSVYEFCGDCGKPVRVFLEKVDKKLKARERSAK